MRNKMNLITLASFAFTFAALRVFGQDVTAPSADEIQQYLAVLAGIGGLKGAALIVAIVQGLLLFFRSKLADFAGKWKLLIVSLLTFLGAFFGVVLTGKPYAQAFFDGAVLTAFQVFAHQAWTQFAPKKNV